MAVVNGQPVNAAVTNAAFVDKNTDETGTIAIFKLENDVAASGAHIANLQREMNKSSQFVRASQLIEVTGEIELTDYKGNQIVPISGDGTAVSANPLPFNNATIFDGQIVKLLGLSASNTVTLVYNDAAGGLVTNGSATLGRGDILELVYIESEDRWFEISRNF